MSHRPSLNTFTNPWPSFVGLNPFQLAWRALNYYDRKKCQLPEVLTVQVVKPKFEKETKKTVVTWLGHAASCIQVGGINIITDPVFAQRCSPSQWVGPKRYNKQ